MMDGISAMDTGNNGQMLNMNIESIAEVKVLTQGYQAEYGRSSGLQITAVTKSGTNRFRGSAYDLRPTPTGTRTRWVNAKNGDPKPKSTSEDSRLLDRRSGRQAGRQQQAVLLLQPRVPSDQRPDQQRQPDPAPRADRARARGRLLADARQQRRAVHLITDPTSTALQRGRPDGCFADGGVLGKIPASRLYAPGLAMLNRYPLPNLTQAPGTNYNYEIDRAASVQADLLQQPARPPRLPAVVEAARHRQVLRPAAARADDARAASPGFTDVLTSRIPFITNYAVTVNYTISPTTFLEGTYGFIQNELTGGNEGGILDQRVGRTGSTEPAGLPAALPGRGRRRSGATTRYEVLQRRQAAVLGRHQHQPAARLQLGRPHRRGAAATSAIPAG